MTATDPVADRGAALLDLARRVVDRAQPGEQVEVYVGRGASTSVRAYEGEVESLTSAESSGVGIRVINDHRQGFAHCGTFDDDVVADTLAEARDNAAFGEPDEFNALVSSDGVTPLDLDAELWNDDLAAFPTDEKVARAIELEAMVRGRDPRVAGVRVAAWGDSSGEAAIVSTTGLSAWSRGTWCSVSVSALAVDGDETKVGGGSDVARSPFDLDLEVAAVDAVDRAVRMFGAVKPPSQRLAIVFEPRLATTLLSILGGMLGGERVVKGRSPFAERVGEQITSPLLTLVDDPTDRRSFGADPFDGEGLANRRNELVVDGVLQGFLHNSYTGRRAGVPSTASAIRGYSSTPGVGAQALAVAPGEGDLDSLIASVDNGLLVQSLTGLHSGVNAVSGDFSVGAEGLMIRDGKLAEPVREATIASTVQRLLLDIRAVGADIEWRPSGTAASTLVIDDVSLSGI